MKARITFMLTIFLGLNSLMSTAIGEPGFKIKAIHVPLKTVNQKAYFLSTIDKIESRFNTIVIQVNNKVIYEKHPEITSSEAENMVRTQYSGPPMSKKDLYEIVTYAKKKGLEVIPEVKFLTHQEKFLRRSHPELMFNEVTYDPQNEKVYAIAFAVIDELIDIIKPRYFHIGHDEMREFRREKKPQADSKIPSYVDFANHANRLSKYLKERNVKAMMWGDMLLNPAGFNVSKDMGRSFHGHLQNYYKAIDLLDKDIIIVDWHYWGEDKIFPSADYFLSKGFNIIGCTWKSKTTNNFSKYLCKKDDDGVLGMMATTWKHFVKQHTEIMNEIIMDSYMAFSSCDH